MTDHRFQIHLGGIIELLSNHLYSGPQVFVRELLQNGVDALTARAHVDPPRASDVRALRAEVLLGDGAPRLVFEDDGVGLTEDEVHRFLATIGESSKRGELVDRTRTDFLGQFGIGLLSCFVVSDEIEVVSRSARAPDAPVVQWLGRRDGTYTLRTLDQARAPGTRVVLKARAGLEEWFESDRVRELLQRFGALLPAPIHFGEGVLSTVLNAHGAPWRRGDQSPAERHAAVLAYGQKLFETPFLDWVPLRSETGDVDGVAFVLPYSPSLAQRRAHRVYLKGMLLSEQADDLLPEWAFFVKAVVNANALRPTASRESFYEDASLATARDALGGCLRAYLLHLAKHEPARLEQLIAVHHLAIKALSVHDDEFFRLFVDWLPFETSVGRMALGDLRRKHTTLRYTPSVDEFRQMAPVATSQGFVLVNCGYAYDHELVQRAELLLGQAIERVDAQSLADALDDLDVHERDQARPLLRVATRVLTPFGVEAQVRKFRPEALPTFYGAGEDVLFQRTVSRTKAQTTGLWSGVLDDVAGAADARAVLCFNWRCGVVRKLVQLDDEELVEKVVQMLYVQALLLGRHPLEAREMELLNAGLLGLLEWTVEQKAPEGGWVQ